MKQIFTKSEPLKPLRRVKQLNSNVNREEAIKKAMSVIANKCGESSIMSKEEKENQLTRPLPSGILSLDDIIGIGGYPQGRLIEVFGKEASGKTTVALHAAAQTQKNNGFVAYIDIENSLDPEYAQNIGVDLDNLYLSQPSSAEQAFYTIEEFVLTGAFDLIIVDSVAALTPQKEIDGIYLSGEQARLMSEQLRKLVAIVNQSKCVILFINQIRSTMNKNIGEFETTPGGKALKFYASVRIEVSSKDAIKNTSGEIIGKKTELVVQKNKVASPFKKATVANIYGEGLTPYMDIIKIGMNRGLIKKRGNWYTYNSKKIGNGIFDVKKYLKEHTDVYESLMREVQISEKIHNRTENQTVYERK